MLPSSNDGQSWDTVQEQAALLDLVSDAILVRDLGGIVRYWNQRAEHVYGYTKAEAVGQPVSELLHSRYPLPLTEIEAWVQRTGRWEGELRHTNSRGEELVIYSRWVLRRDASGRPAGMLESNRDITERKQAQLQAQRLQQLELAQAEHLATLGEIAAGLAHEIKNPLASIAAALEVLCGQCDGQSEVMADVRTQVTRIRGIVNDLLHYARPRPLDMEQGDINMAVASAIHLLTPAARQREAQLSFCAGVLPPVSHDPEQVQRMVANLILNAVQATAPGTGLVRISTRVWGGDVAIEVADNGTGIAAADLDNIFRPFFTTKRDEGNGLGLALCLRIAELHGGRLRVASKMNRGSVFTVLLPLAAACEP
ncbi:MAG: two-component system sensor histidine kinase NtrB [Terriglobales bacterium]